MKKEMICCFIVAALMLVPQVMPAHPTAKGEMSSLYQGELRRQGVGTDVSSLLAALDSKVPVVRMIAAEEMGRQGVAAAVPKLKTLLADPADIVRLRAAESLLKLGETSGVSVLREQLGSPDKAIVARAARVLAANGDDSGLDKVRPTLTSSDPSDREWAVMAFAESRNPAELYPALRLASKDSHRMTRLMALNRLGQIASPEAVEILADVLQSSDHRDRGIAATLLNATRRVEAIPYLIDALTNDDAEVRRAAVLGLTYLSGHAIGPRTKARVANLDDAHVVQAEWRQWWEANKATSKIGELGPPKYEDEPKK